MSNDRMFKIKIMKRKFFIIVFLRFRVSLIEVVFVIVRWVVLKVVIM